MSDDRPFRSKRFTKYPCHECGRLITNNGLGRHAHMKMHEREYQQEREKKAPTLQIPPPAVQS